MTMALVVLPGRIGGSTSAGEHTVERVGERLLLALTVRRVTACLDARASQAVHEVAHREAFADALGRVFVASWIDDDHALGYQKRGQWNVRGDGDVARYRMLGDVPIGDVGAAV